MTRIESTTVLITGASRGIGHALVDEALARGRSHCLRRDAYAARAPRLPCQAGHARRHQQRADHGSRQRIGSLDLLINNAGIARYDDLSDPAVIAEHLAVNLFGTLAVTRAFTPLLARSNGAIVNNLSVNAFAPLPLIASYSVSKAAAFSATQSLRTLLSAQGVSVYAVLTGIVDTDMSRGVEIPKDTPAAVAAAILDGVEKGEHDIFPDAMSRPMADNWRTGAGKALEVQYAALTADTLAGAR